MPRPIAAQRRRNLPKVLHIRRWAETLGVSLMDLKFTLATNREFAAVASSDYVSEGVARRAAAIARKAT